ncbi:ras-related protein Rap-1b [Sipha flava]|uniref:Ras-related protein Rap-1b n=1 Tax=Sipha flava TaxID=143950 RepID=A0A2S2Q211_9HEMI|nr:ras-related protein Rap-1b [Sipha flava]XP_025406905.1 ras-related protein Rap-1b [Sipha flava]XP_025406906.1 ras-related protein Rap-1b [Sipha flava]XP_025406907.1 ras-related protein Rap-1b [Sipha flava]XP_025406908.1 ras-related protein Rap-1b [Sipha flava]XP_025406909.1 ras-related protein Rap-1b [Sipha flava]
MADPERTRLVVLGDAGVGKSAICKRFLYNSFCSKYKTTVEDLYSKEFNVGTAQQLKVDILDTCGNPQFPAMRRLSIANANAFMFVYSIDCERSFETVKRNFEEVREQREDYQMLPIVIAGNKLDLPSEHRRVTVEDASEWLYCELPKMRVKLIECSAKENVNVRDLFKCLLVLSRKLNGSEDQAAGQLKRRSSAYVSHTKSSRRAENASAVATTSASPSSAASGHGRDELQHQQQQQQERSKPRSRSLIRRCSRKTKQQIRDTTAGGNGGGVDDCNVS